MAIVRFADNIKTAVLTPVRDAIDAGPAAGTVKIFAGIMAATPATPPAGTLLGTLTFADPCSSSPGSLSTSLTMGNITLDSAADATGTAAWARVADSTGNTVMDIDVSVTGGGGTMQMNTTSIVIGSPILITSFAITVG